ncbi:hypothetical protein BDW22DRAFT_1353630 [Trametopsis cervina]|nr:hypothetical protein BDW22DRAFT_1353630 [Trametopsis cervina]
MGKYTAEQKLQLLNNLDLETSHRIQQLESWLSDHLMNFQFRQEGLISHLPKALRSMTMRDFAKYNGDIKKAAQGLQAENFGQVEAIDRTTRKRKWIESQEQEAEQLAAKGLADDGVKPFKNARMTTATPKKPIVAASSSRGHLQNAAKTPSQFRIAPRIPSMRTPSPHKPAAPRLLPSAFPTSRPNSPTKSRIPFASPSKPRLQAPSTSNFNPAIPGSSSSSYPRWPRKDESMLSVNGSPLANPLNLDLSTWLSRNRDLDHDMPGDPRSNGAAHGHKRTNSIIVRSTSSSSHPAATGGTHSRSNSNSTTNGKATPGGFMPTRNHAATTKSEADKLGGQASVAALVSVPTADGHFLEFDPFQTTPREIDALEGLTSSAKKKAKEDMRNLVIQAVERWRIE